MVRMRIYLLSNKYFRIFLRVLPEGTPSKIKILSTFDKKDFKELEVLDYIEDSLLYDVVLTNNTESGIYNSYLKLVFIDEYGKEIDSSNETETFVKSNAINRGIIKTIQNDFKVACILNGGKAYFMKTKKDKEKCPSCWDFDLRSSNNSNCPECGGSGYVITYFRPYKTTIGTIANALGEEKQTGEVGKIDTNSVSSFTSLADYLLSTDDIVFSITYGNVYRVISTSVSDTQGNQVLQRVSCQQIPSESKEAEAIVKKLTSVYGENYVK